jgi:Notch-like protein
LACQNGGVCSLDNSGDEPAYMYWEDGGSKQHESMWCKCPEGYKGRLCDVVSVPCGDSWCFHGGTCLEHSIDGKVQYDCDCTPTYTDEASYAGTMCQFAATSYCSKSSGGVNGNLFCTNHGRCNDHPEQGCDCDDPYTGFSCEFVLQDSMNNSTASIIRNNGTDDVWLGDDANITPIDGTLVYDELDDIKCDLKCQHGGTCQVGVKDNGVLEDIAQKSVPSLNVSDDSESSFMHCVCPDGYYGNLCESLVEICGDNEHMCLHGGKCIRNDQDEHACDCSTEETEKVPSVIYAGEACEHAVPRSNVCSDEGYSSMETSPVSFCIHGTCKQRVAAGERFVSRSCRWVP